MRESEAARKWGVQLESAPSTQPHLKGQLIWCLGCVPFYHMGSSHCRNIE